MRLLLSILCVLTSVQIVPAQSRTVNPTRMNVVLVAWRGVPDGRCEGFSRSHDQVGGKCSPVGASAAISGRRTGGLSREGERAARGVGRPRSNRFPTAGAAPTRAALPTRSRRGPISDRFSSGTTPGIVIADWACSPRRRSIKGAPASSRPSGSASSRTPTHAIPSASSRGRRRRLESRPKCGSTRLRTPSNVRLKRPVNSQPKCLTFIDTFRTLGKPIGPDARTSGLRSLNQMIARIAGFVLAWVIPLAAQTQTAEQLLPLAVGNSWTYEHRYSDSRTNGDGTWVYPAGSTQAEVTISILRTEVIDGETYYVFSDPPNTLDVHRPVHFIAGKKLRWDGYNLTEHDGTTSFSLYQFDSSFDDTWRPYSVPAGHAHGDTLVSTYSGLTRSQLRSQTFLFFGSPDFLSLGGWDGPSYGYWQYGRSIIFTEHFGVEFSGETMIEGDVIVYGNKLVPIRATFQTSANTRSSDTPSGTTVEWDDFRCYRNRHDLLYSSNRTCGYTPPSTSKSPGSWGLIKDGSR